MAIQIQAKKAPMEYDLQASKFFGTPTIPREWEENFSDDEIFFCQIRLSDIAGMDRENPLPSKGYLYVFLHTAEGNRQLTANLRYYDGEPTLALEGFNGAVEGYEQFQEAYLITFFPCKDTEDCTRLFGTPSDWNYGEKPPKLLLQFDPLDNDMGFLDDMDGFLYLFLEENQGELGVKLHLEYS